MRARPFGFPTLKSTNNNDDQKNDLRDWYLLIMTELETTQLGLTTYYTYTSWFQQWFHSSIIANIEEKGERERKKLGSEVGSI